MPFYRFDFLDDNGAVGAADDFEAEGDRVARKIAEAMIQVNHQYRVVQIWRDGTFVESLFRGSDAQPATPEEA